MESIELSPILPSPSLNNNTSSTSSRNSNRPPGAVVNLTFPAVHSQQSISTNTNMTFSNNIISPSSPSSSPSSISSSTPSAPAHVGELTTTRKHVAPLSKRQLTSLSSFWFGYSFVWFIVLIISTPSQVKDIIGNEKKGTGIAIVSGLSGVFNLFVAIFYGYWNDLTASSVSLPALSFDRAGKNVNSSLKSRLNDTLLQAWNHPRQKSILIGTVIMVITFFLLVTEKTNIYIYAIWYILFVFGTIISSVPYTAYVAESAPTEQKGQMSAYLSTSALLGFLFGAILGAYYEKIGETNMAIIMSVVLVISMCGTLFGECIFETLGRDIVNAKLTGRSLNHRQYVPLEMEQVHDNNPQMDLHQPPQRSFTQYQSKSIILQFKAIVLDLLRPLIENRDFRLVLFSRFLFQIAISTFQQFMQYWIEDTIDIPPSMAPTEAVSMALIPLLLLSPITTFLLTIEHVEHHWIGVGRRKIIVLISTILMCIPCLLIVAGSMHSFAWTFIISGIFGCGYGPFLSVEFSMAMDVLPPASIHSEQSIAKDLSIWHSALVVPGIIATPLAGLIRDGFEVVGQSIGFAHFGYRVLFLGCLCAMVAGLIFTYRIKSIR